MSTETWERVEPPEPCDSPDGHSYVDIMSAEGMIPVACQCSRCGRQYQIVLLPG